MNLFILYQASLCAHQGRGSWCCWKHFGLHWPCQLAPVWLVSWPPGQSVSLTSSDSGLVSGALSNASNFPARALSEGNFYFTWTCPEGGRRGWQRQLPRKSLAPKKSVSSRRTSARRGLRLAQGEEEKWEGGAQSVAHDGMSHEREEKAMLLNSHLSLLLHSGRLSSDWRGATQYGWEVCVSLDVGKKTTHVSWEWKWWWQLCPSL